MLVPLLEIIKRAFLVFCEVTTRCGSAYLSLMPYEIFEVRGSWFPLSGGTDYQFQRLGEVIDQRHAIKDFNFLPTRIALAF